ncbi:pentapeptide repeat-containing protein [Glycomyces sp. MUSA5-2]|uniref:Pentapeptide repeat-containing protein n=1 Tax=Glycomyces artemisiae TaxID=1076443 RepID=A0A850C3Z0_9ACTN|nr:pentapeptide repeat-containing protein [Glycomyces artemisiae]
MPNPRDPMSAFRTAFKRSGVERPTFPLSVHVLLMVVLASALLSGLLWLFTSDQTSPLSPDPDDRTTLEVIRLSLYAIAGVGGVIALTVSYRKQRITEATEVREATKLFNERFASAADQLSSDHAANRLAGVYAMAALADDWDAGRQTCINVLCAYVRMPYETPPFRHEREALNDPPRFRAVLEERLIRHTVINVVGGRLRREPVPGRTWHEHDFDFTGTNLDGGNLNDALFLGRVSFAFGRFTAGTIDFSRVRFEGPVDFTRARFLGARLRFTETLFAGPVLLSEMTIAAGLLDFSSAHFARDVAFDGTAFTGGQVHFTKTICASPAVGVAPLLDFNGASFTGTSVIFDRPQIDAATLDFSRVADWSHPPVFNLADERDAVRLPETEDR